MDTENADAVEDVADVIQIGARNMQNFSLLRRVAQARRPILLKRGMSATLEEWLMSAEYLLAGGNYDVILCERGVRTFSDHSRNTLDLSVIPPIKATFALADSGRSQSWNRQARLRAGDGTGRAGGRRQRPIDRGPSRSRPRRVGRRAVARSRPVRAAARSAQSVGRATRHDRLRRRSPRADKPILKRCSKIVGWWEGESEPAEGIARLKARPLGIGQGDSG